MKWIVYRKRDLHIVKRFYLQKDAERYCRQRHKRENSMNWPYREPAYAAIHLGDMTEAAWKTWTLMTS